MLSQPEAILQAITSSPPNSTALRAANTAFNACIKSGNLLDTPARKYAKSLTQATERIAAQVAILQKERIDQEEVLGNRKERLSGKRVTIKGHFVLSTAEICDKVKAAELETLRRKALSKRCKKAPPLKKRKKAPSKKRKRQATPSEDEAENAEESGSNFSDYITVA